MRDGLERMGSISESIQASGRTPGMEYARRVVRAASANEAAKMGIAVSTRMVELHRRITADGDFVAYSFDLIPLSVLPPGFDIEVLQGSIFAFFHDHLALLPTLGIAEVHAVMSKKIAWGEGSSQHTLFLLLDQLQYSEEGILIGCSQSYFVEQNYAFRLKRTLN